MHQEPTNTQTIQARLSHLDLLIRNTNQTLSNLKEQRNGLASIYSLSGAILLAIFEQALCSWQTEPMDVESMLTWRGFSVSRRWRHLCQGSDILKAIVKWDTQYDEPGHRLDPLRELRRSGSAPLRIKLALTASDTALEIGKAIALHFHRLTWLHVTISRSKSMSNFFKAFRTPVDASRLNYLCLAFIDQRPNPVPGPMIPASLLQSCQDGLQYLSVTNLRISLLPSWHLTSLKLYAPLLQPPPDMRSFLEILLTFPQLETLVLGPDSLPSGHPIKYSAKTNLPSLKFLAISDIARRSLRFLTAITLSPEATLHIHAVDLTLPGTFDVFLFSLRTCANELGLGTYRSLRIACVNDQLRLTFGKGIDPSPARYRVDLEIVVRCRSTADQRRALDRVAKVIDFRSITWLDATAAQHLCTSVWNRLFKRLPTLKDVTTFLYDSLTVLRLRDVFRAACRSRSRRQSMQFRTLHVCGFPDMSTMKSAWYYYVDNLAQLLYEMQQGGRPLILELAVCPPYFDVGAMTLRLREWCEELAIDGIVSDGRLLAEYVCPPRSELTNKVYMQEVTMMSGISPNLFHDMLDNDEDADSIGRSVS